MANIGEDCHILIEFIIYWIMHLLLFVFSNLSMLRIKSPRHFHQGVYQCQATNSVGQVFSGNYTVNIKGRFSKYTHNTIIYYPACMIKHVEINFQNLLIRALWLYSKLYHYSTLQVGNQTIMCFTSKYEDKTSFI